MPRRDAIRALLAVGMCVVAAATGGCGGADPAPIRVGVLVECSGFIANTHDLALAAAALPLVERGATAGAHGAVDGARVAGRPLEVVPACTELTTFALLVAAVRELVEERHVDAVLGPIGTTEGAVMRQIAAHYPDVTFLVGPGQARATTLAAAPLPNLYRFGPDGAQAVAGLGTFAYRDLGWRSAVVVAEDWQDGWEVAAGFVTEFCALGGRVVERDWALFSPDAADAAARHATLADGVALIGSLSDPLPYLRALAAAQPQLDRHLVLGGEAFVDPAVLAADGLDPTGVLVASPIPLLPATGDLARFEARLTAAYPDLSTAGPLSLALFNYVSMSALAAALEATGGDPGAHQATLRAALSTQTIATPIGPVRLDANHQAIVRGYLDRIVTSPAGPAGERLRSIDDVDQAFGGAITAASPQPNHEQPVCRSTTPPPWAR